MRQTYARYLILLVWLCAGCKVYSLMSSIFIQRNTHKKSGTALLLFRISRLSHAFCSEQATLSPRRYVSNPHTTPNSMTKQEYTSRGHQYAAMSWNNVESVRSEMPRTKRFDALLYQQSPTFNRYNPKA